MLTTYLVCSLSVILASVSVSTAEEDCSEHQAYQGGPIEQITGVQSTGDCQTLCQKMRGCAYWTLDKQAKCWLNNETATVVTGRDVLSTGELAGPRKCQDPCASEGIGYGIYKEDIISAVSASTYQECSSRCNDVKSCVIWVWFGARGSNKCELGRVHCTEEKINQPGGCNTPSQFVSPGVYTGSRGRPTCKSVPEPEGCSKSKGYRGGPIDQIPGVKSAQDCQALCERDRKCAYWTFDNNKMCWMNDRTATAYENKDAQLSGPWDCSDQPLMMSDQPLADAPAHSGPCAAKNQEYSIPRGYLIGESTASSYQDCSNRCKSNPKCFVWNFFGKEGSICKLGADHCKPNEACSGNGIKNYPASHRVYSGYSSSSDCPPTSSFPGEYGSYVDVGCWRNKVGHKLDNLERTDKRLDKYNYKKRTDAINKCFDVSSDAGYDFFAVGNKGQCWAGNGDDYKGYGQPRNCPSSGKGKHGIVNVYINKGE